MNISIRGILLIVIYLSFIIYNIYKMRELLIADRNRIESFADIIITVILILLPIIGTFIIVQTLEEQLSLEEKHLKKIKIRKFINKLFFIK